MFYNATGRQVGTGTFKKEKSVLAINNGTHPIAGNNPFKFIYKEDGGIYRIYYNADIDDDSAKCKVNLPEYVVITALGIDGEKIQLCPPVSNRFGKDNDTYIFYLQYGKVNYSFGEIDFYWVNVNYAGGARKGFYIKDASKHAIEIFYIEL